MSTPEAYIHPRDLPTAEDRIAELEAELAAKDKEVRQAQRKVSDLRLAKIVRADVKRRNVETHAKQPIPTKHPAPAKPKPRLRSLDALLAKARRK